MSDISDIIRDVLSDEMAADYLDETRISMICRLAENRVKHLREFAASHTKQNDSTDDDVKQNNATEYSKH